MSTNYFVVKKVNKDDVINEIKNIINCVSSFSIGDALKQYADAKFSEDEHIHIGSCSCNLNFKFIFNHNNGKYYEKTRKSIDKFIRENELFNEYDVKISPDEFWKIVDMCQNGLDNKTYYTTIGKEYNNDLVSSDNYHEEYSDGLRFSTSTNFI